MSVQTDLTSRAKARPEHPNSWIFFDGAVRALRARTLDMMVLVAVAVGAGWLYSLYVTLTGGGDVFYEAATVLTSFSLDAAPTGGGPRSCPMKPAPGPS